MARRLADGRRHIAVRPRAAVRDGGQRLPHAALKGRRPHIERQIKARRLAVQIRQQRGQPRFQARSRTVERRGRKFSDQCPGQLGFRVAEPHSADAFVGRGQ